MSRLVWQNSPNYMVPSRTSCGRYQIVRRVGGSLGPVYRAQHIAGVGVAGDLGINRDTFSEAVADAEEHHNEIVRQQNAAARSPV